MHTPASTYRIQLNLNFNFAQAEKILPYLKKLGVSWVYLSPITQANPGSLHGYDVTNPNQINEEAGGLAGFEAFSRTLNTLDMGLLVDFVPNHMAASENNPWWHDVVTHGSASHYASYFDIFWHTSSAEKLSYRRFFDINELICLRMEDPAVFAATHELMLRLISNNQITGIRLDHIDGLKNPGGYLDLLAKKINKPFYTVVEKILARNETLPTTWDIAGTTGYDFTNELNQVFVNSTGYSKLLYFYEHLPTLDSSITEIRYRNNKLVIESLFKNEFNNLIDAFQKIASAQGNSFNTTDVEKLLLEICAVIPVYRTYIHDNSLSARDEKIIDGILTAVEEKSVDPHCLAFFRQAIKGHLPEEINKTWLEWVGKWQVFTGPMIAKGYEDTTCYQFNPLLSLNEVGSEPLYFNTETTGDVALFHHYNQYKHSHYPQSLNATSTHDTKRGEDVRARLNVLTEVPQEWTLAVTRWRQWNESKKTAINDQLAPDVNDELMLYQTLLGAWPLSPQDVPKFKLRLRAFLPKALREGKVHSTWSKPNAEYEKAVFSFYDALLAETPDNEFLPDFIKFQQKLAFFGILNSLAQTALKLTCPGIPDIYQGNEVWQFDLVDPDNRHAVDFAHITELLDAVPTTGPEKHLTESWTNGAIKLYLTQRLLNLRRENIDLFSEGEYIPLTATGSKADHIIAFARRHKNNWLCVVVPRWCVKLCAANQFPLGPAVWEDTQIILPAEAPHRWRSMLTTEELHSTQQAGVSFHLVAQLFNKLPVGVYISDD